MPKNFEIKNSTAEFLMFVMEGKENGVQVTYKDETIWCTQKAMATLFDVGVPAISKHLKNIFDTGELSEKSVISILETTTSFISSPSSKIFFRCLLIAGTPTPKSCEIAFCVLQIVSSFMMTCTLPSSSGRL